MDEKISTELAPLLDAFVDGPLTPAEDARLQEMLRARPEAREDFVRYVDQHMALQTRGSARLMLPLDLAPRRPRRLQMWLGIAAAAAAVLAAAGLTLSRSGTSADVRGAWRSPAGGIAVRRGGTEIDAEAAGGLEPGDRILTRRDAGASFGFGRGGLAALAPATDLELAGRAGFVLRGGGLSLRVDGASLREPVLVRTPDVEVTVAGTVLRVGRDGAGSVVEVLEGAVAVRALRETEARSVAAGDIARCPVGGVLSVTRPDAGANRLVNPSMTDGGEIPAGWCTPFMQEGTLAVSRDRETFCLGPASLRLESVGGRASGNTSQPLPGVEGKRLRVLGYVRHFGAGQRYWSVALHAYDGRAPEQQNLFWQGLASGWQDTDWQWFSGEFFVAAEARDVRLRVLLVGEGAVWLDEASVVVVDVP